MIQTCGLTGKQFGGNHFGEMFEFVQRSVTSFPDGSVVIQSERAGIYCSVGHLIDALEGSKARESLCNRDPDKDPF